MELRFLLAATRRGWALILVVGIVGLAIGGFLGTTAQKMYVSRASLDITVPQTSALLNSSYSEDPNRYIATQIGIIGSDAIARRAAALVPGSTKKSIEQESTVSQRGTSDIVDIVGKTTSAKRAAAVANALATTYASQQGEQLAAPLRTQIDGLQSQINALQTRISAATSGTVSSTNSNLAGALETQYAQASQNLTQAQLALRLSTSSVTVFDTASPSPSPQSRHAALKAGIGVGAGLVIGYILAILFVLVRPRLARPDDVEDILGISVAADLPYVPAGQHDRMVERHSQLLHEALPPPVIVWDQELVRLSALVQASQARGKCRSLLVTSVEGGAGVSMLADDFVGLFRSTGMAVELVDVESGVSTIGDGSTPVGQEAGGARRRDVGGVSARSSSKSEGASINGHRWLRSVDSRAELVVFDGAPLSSSADSVVLARSVDVVMVLIPVPSSTRSRLIRSLRAALTDSEAQVLFVTNRNKRTSSQNLAHGVGRRSAQEEPTSTASSV